MHINKKRKVTLSEKEKNKKKKDYCQKKTKNERWLASK
jgi:hypothetical protein